MQEEEQKEHKQSLHITPSLPTTADKITQHGRVHHGDAAGTPQDELHGHEDVDVWREGDADAKQHQEAQREQNDEASAEPVIKKQGNRAQKNCFELQPWGVPSHNASGLFEPWDVAAHELIKGESAANQPQATCA